MNYINFFNDKKKFPLSTQVLDFIQNIIKQAHKLALIGGGDKYILTGCDETAANTYATGYVVVNGEILPFMGGTGSLTSSVRIKDIKEDVIAGYETYTDAITERYLEFGSNIGGQDTYVWNDFRPIKSNKQLEASCATKEELSELKNLVMPKGFIGMWSGSISDIPYGFVLCNGDTIVDFGVVPDLRGRFIVGYDDTTVNVPNNVVDMRNSDGSVVLNYATIGNRGGKPDVTLTESQLPEFKVKTNIRIGTDDDQGGVDGTQLDAATNSNSVVFEFESNPIGGSQSHENRPPYYVLAYIIKVI